MRIAFSKARLRVELCLPIKLLHCGLIRRFPTLFQQKVCGSSVHLILVKDSAFKKPKNNILSQILIHAEPYCIQADCSCCPNVLFRALQAYFSSSEGELSYAYESVKRNSATFCLCFGFSAAIETNSISGSTQGGESGEATIFYVTEKTSVH